MYRLSTSIENLALKVHRNKNDGGQAKRIYLAKILERGTRAEDLQEFLEEFMDIEKSDVLSRLDSAADSYELQQEYKASMRLYTYLSRIITAAKEKKIELSRAEGGNNSDR